MSIATMPFERSRLFAQVAVELVDDFTGQAPIHPVDATLEASLGTEWTPVTRRSVLTASGVVAFPGLGLSSRPAETPPRLYRVRVASDAYLPLYGAVYPLGQDGREFTVQPWNHQQPPTASAQPATIFLLPRPSYPRPASVPTLFGRVEDPSGAPVVDALVEESTRERVLTDERGEFALPLRWVAAGAVATIDARDRLGRLGQIVVNVPADLGAGHVITVS